MPPICSMMRLGCKIDFNNSTRFCSISRATKRRLFEKFGLLQHACTPCLKGNRQETVWTVWSLKPKVLELFGGFNTPIAPLLLFLGSLTFSLFQQQRRFEVWPSEAAGLGVASTCARDSRSSTTRGWKTFPTRSSAGESFGVDTPDG